MTAAAPGNSRKTRALREYLRVLTVCKFDVRRLECLADKPSAQEPYRQKAERRQTETERARADRDLSGKRLERKTGDEGPDDTP